MKLKNKKKGQMMKLELTENIDADAKENRAKMTGKCESRRLSLINVETVLCEKVKMRKDFLTNL